MQVLVNLIIYVILAFWIGFIAVFSIQNITEVSIKFLVLESINIPVGVLLSFCVAIGLIIGAITPLIFAKSSSRKRRKIAGNNY